MMNKDTRQRSTSVAGSVVSEPVTGIDASLGKRELNALVDITAQNVRILGEDLSDVIEYAHGCNAISDG